MGRRKDGKEISGKRATKRNDTTGVFPKPEKPGRKPIATSMSRHVEDTDTPEIVGDQEWRVSLPMTSTEQSGFLVHVAHRAKITTKDLKICVLPDIVLRHFEHAEMEVCDWAKRATCDKDYWDFVGVLECLREAAMRESVIRGICEGLREMGGGNHGEARGEGKKQTSLLVLNLTDDILGR